MPEDKGYAGDLDGRPLKPSQCASSMSCGVCVSGRLIGVDFYDEKGETIAHGHLDIGSALTFAESFSDAIEEVHNNTTRPH